MADFLGVPYGGDRGSELLWIADAALCSELPLGWAEHGPTTARRTTTRSGRAR